MLVELVHYSLSEDITAAYFPKSFDIHEYLLFRRFSFNSPFETLLSLVTVQNTAKNKNSTAFFHC